MRIAGNPDKALLKIVLYALEKAEANYCSLHNKEAHLIDDSIYKSIIMHRAEEIVNRTIKFYDIMQSNLEKGGEYENRTK